MTKLTKQGVRDLNHLKGRPKGRMLPEPPVAVDCRHRRKREVFELGLLWTVCEDCKETIGEPR